MGEGTTTLPREIATRKKISPAPPKKFIFCNKNSKWGEGRERAPPHQKKFPSKFFFTFSFKILNNKLGYKIWLSSSKVSLEASRGVSASTVYLTLLVCMSIMPCSRFECCKKMLFSWLLLIYPHCEIYHKKSFSYSFESGG